MNEAVNNKTALITGASSGIGASFARFLAERGLHVIMAARRENRLSELSKEIRAQGGNAQYYPCDISSADAREDLADQIFSEVGHVDILINNAGFGWYGYFHEMAWIDASRMIAVNMEAAAHLTRLFLPGMLKEKNGHIVNISSIVGGMPNQGIAMYSASKAFLDAFSTALYRELHGSGVHASTMRLGPVDTEFYDQAKRMKNGSPVPAERYAIPVKRVNAALWRLLEHPRRAVYVPGWLCISRWVEPLFAGLIDQLGPLLLRRNDRPEKN